MKKIFAIGLFLLTACSSPSVTQTSPSQPTLTATRLMPTATAVPSATATETITPLPTFTPEPPPLFFTEEFDASPVYWSMLSASGDANRVETLNQDGKLTFQLNNSNAWLYAIFGAHEYNTVHLETSVESTGSITNYMGLICSYDEQKGWFEFNISNDGSYSVLYGTWLAEGVADYMPIADGASEYIVIGNPVNEMGLDCLGNTLQLYINGKLFRSIDVTRFELEGGKIGLAVASFQETPVTLAFDWVKVSEP